MPRAQIVQILPGIGIGLLLLCTLAILLTVRRKPTDTTIDQPAGLWLRVAALCIDLAIVGAAQIALLSLCALLDAWQAFPGAPGRLLVWIIMLVPLVYFTVLTTGRQTVGKQLAGLRVDAIDNAPLAVAPSCLRAFLVGAFAWLRVLAIADIITLAARRDRRSLHDLMARTRVRQWHTPHPVIVAAPLLLALVAGGGVLGLLRPFIMETYFVPSGSMRPTLTPDDKLIGNRLYYRLASLRRGDIIVFTPPPAAVAGLPPTKDAWLKRVVGLPGESIVIQGGVGIFINGQQVTEIFEAPKYDWPPRNAAGKQTPYRIPYTACFVLGDARDASHDSHSWRDPSTGEPRPDVPLANIQGKITYRLWPMKTAGPVL